MKLAYDTLGMRLGALGAAFVAALGIVRADITVSGDHDPSSESFWTSGGDASQAGTIGVFADGELTVTNGDFLELDSLWLGQESGATGTATLTGAFSELDAGGVFVGENGIGYLDILNGSGVFDYDGFIGYNPGSEGYVTLDGTNSIWINGGDYFVIGDEGHGELTVSGGGYAYAEYDAYIGRFEDATGEVTVTGTNSEIEVEDDFFIGYDGQGTLLIQNGALVSNYDGEVAYNPGSMGTVTVDGATTRWENNDELKVASEGVGYVTIQNGATVTSVDTAQIGVDASGDGTIVVTGSGSHLDLSGDLEVGSSGKGTIIIENGGYVSGAYGVVGAYDGSEGYLTVQSGGEWDFSQFSFIGYDGMGTAVVQDGGIASSLVLIIGTNTGSTGALTVQDAGSSWTTTSDFIIGDDGTGTLYVLNGGTIQIGAEGYIGNASGGSGTATVRGEGSTLNGDQSFRVGNDGMGTLNVSQGGEIVLGRDLVVGTTGTLNLSVTGDDMITLGVAGEPGWGEFINDGTFNIMASGSLAAGSYAPVVVAAGLSFGGSGNYHGVGGTWNGVSNTFEVSAITTDGTGDLSGKRVIYFDSLVVSFGDGVGTQAFDVTELSIDEIEGEMVLAAFDFETTIDELTMLSFLIGEGYDMDAIGIWHLADGETEWTLFDPELIDYTNDYLSITVTSFSSYAVTVPEPSAAALGLLGMGVMALRRRKR